MKFVEMGNEKDGRGEGGGLCEVVAGLARAMPGRYYRSPCTHAGRCSVDRGCRCRRTASVWADLRLMFGGWTMVFWPVSVPVYDL